MGSNSKVLRLPTLPSAPRLVGTPTTCTPSTPLEAQTCAPALLVAGRGHWLGSWQVAAGVSVPCWCSSRLEEDVPWVRLEGSSRGASG